MFGNLLQLVGKKFLAKILGLVLVPLLAILNKKFSLGLSDSDIVGMLGLVATYIVGQSFADGMSKGATSSVAQAPKPEEKPEAKPESMPNSDASVLGQ